MKKISVLLLSALLFAAACKEDTKKDEVAQEKTFEENLAEHYMSVYKSAMKISDIITATTSLNSYLTVVGDSIKNTSPYMDTLITLYEEMRQYAPLYLLSNERLKYNPNDTDMLALNVGVAQVVGKLGEVSNRCLTLVNMFPDDPSYKFSYAASLLENRRIKEGEQVLLDIANDPLSLQQSVPFTSYDANGQPRQNTLNAKIGAYMKLGQLYEILKDKTKATNYYRKALAVDKKFKPAAQAILALKNGR